MSELNSESAQARKDPARAWRYAALIAAIIAGTTVVLCCIAACTLIVSAFIANAPW